MVQSQSKIVQNTLSQVNVSCLQVYLEEKFEGQGSILLHLHEHNQHCRTAHMHMKLVTKRRYTMG